MKVFLSHQGQYTSHLKPTEAIVLNDVCVNIFALYEDISVDLELEHFEVTNTIKQIYMFVVQFASNRNHIMCTCTCSAANNV